MLRLSVNTLVPDSLNWCDRTVTQPLTSGEARWPSLQMQWQFSCFTQLAQALVARVTLSGQPNPAREHKDHAYFDEPHPLFGDHTQILTTAWSH